MTKIEIPKEATTALGAIKHLLADELVGGYLYGSAVMGGLRPESDVDLMVVTNCELTDVTRLSIIEGLLRISGRPGNANGIRPLEVTVVNLNDVVPWRYPPKLQFMYGEWLRGQFEKGEIPSATEEPDLALLLAQLQKKSVPLYGPEAGEILEPIPWADLRTAMKDSLPGLVASLKGDERNVILTLARMWFTAANGDFRSKDQAAAWAMRQLPEEQAALLDQARKAYLGEVVDHWEDKEKALALLVDQVKSTIETLLTY